MADLADSELVLIARSGDQAAFNVLVERYQQLAYRVAQRLVSSEQIANELVQEAWLEAYLSLDHLRQPGSFRSWLTGIVLNVCRSYLRKQARRSSRLYILAQQSGEDWLNLSNAPPSPEEVAEARHLHQLLLAAIGDLPQDQQQATLLFYFEFLSLREIAALLGVSEGAVKVRLHRARNRMRDDLHRAGVSDFVELTQRRPKMVEVQIVDVIKDEDRTVVLLLDEPGRRVLPIWIGFFEGAQIAMGVRGMVTPRPMTFNFIAQILQSLDAELEQARVEALKDETFFGVARLRAGEVVKEVDARPSDVLALAARTGSPIFVSKDVLEEAGKPIREGANLPEQMTGLGGMAEIPPPTGEGMDAILKEIEVMLRWPPSRPAEE